uniref:Uncharacterized protein n=1 Tax=Ditylenchus dipsaci TaxID=166011 RepID=A0A915EJH7_9BILA
MQFILPKKPIFHLLDVYMSSIPLKPDDVFAGAFLLCFGLIFMPIYAAVAYVMFKNDKAGDEALGTDLPRLGLVFNVLALHGYIVVQIRSHPFCQLIQNSTKSCQLLYMRCLLCFSLIQVLCTHFQPWYVTFYFEPSSYGMLAEDFGKYLTGGQSLFFFTFHLLMMVIPIFFYGCALGLLLLPCIFNTVVFIIGQVVITIGTGEGKWATWLVLLLFSFNSAVNPVLLLTFSGIIRQKTMLLVMLRRYPNTTNYSNVPQGRNSTSPSPMDKRTINNSMAIRTEYNTIQLLRQISEPILAETTPAQSF